MSRAFDLSNINGPLHAATPPKLLPTETWGVCGLTLITGTPDTPEGIQDGALVFKGDRLLDCGSSAAVKNRHTDMIFFDGSGFTAFPGLINAHTHAAMGFFRGLGHGHTNMIESFLFPAERALTAELLEPLSYSYLTAGLRAGVTTFGDHYYFVDGVAKAIDRLGLRGMVGETCADLGGAFPGRAAFGGWQKQLEKWPFSRRVRPVIAPHAADTVSEEFLKEMASFAVAQKLPLHMHLSQTAGENARVEARCGLSPVAFAQRAGALTDKTLAVHLIAANGDDLKILQSCGTTAGYCPASQIIYEHLAPIAGFHNHEIPVALGTDCAASNDGADILSEMKIAALLAKDRGVPLAHRTPLAILQQATTVPARVFGLEDELGTLEAGKAADVVFARQEISGAPLFNPLTNLIFSTGSRDVKHVLIDGRFVLWQGEPTEVSASDLMVEYQKAVEEIRRRLKK